MYDYKVMRQAYLKFMHDFGDMDIYSFNVYPIRHISEAINLESGVDPRPRPAKALP
jgi:hypothetical protein